MSCTCHWPPIGYPHPRFGYDPDCPRHGTDALLERADQNLDIDEPPGRGDRDQPS